MVQSKPKTFGSANLHPRNTNYDPEHSFHFKKKDGKNYIVRKKPFYMASQKAEKVFFSGVSIIMVMLMQHMMFHGQDVTHR